MLLCYAMQREKSHMGRQSIVFSRGREGQTGHKAHSDLAKSNAGTHTLHEQKLTSVALKTSRPPSAGHVIGIASSDTRVGHTTFKGIRNSQNDRPLTPTMRGTREAWSTSTAKKSTIRYSIGNKPNPPMYPMKYFQGGMFSRSPQQNGPAIPKRPSQTLHDHYTQVQADKSRSQSRQAFDSAIIHPHSALRPGSAATMTHQRNHSAGRLTGYNDSKSPFNQLTGPANRFIGSLGKDDPKRRPYISQKNSFRQQQQPLQQPHTKSQSQQQYQQHQYKPVLPHDNQNNGYEQQNGGTLSSDGLQKKCVPPVFQKESKKTSPTKHVHRPNNKPDNTYSNESMTTQDQKIQHIPSVSWEKQRSTDFSFQTSGLQQMNNDTGIETQLNFAIMKQNKTNGDKQQHTIDMQLTQVGTNNAKVRDTQIHKAQGTATKEDSFNFQKIADYQNQQKQNEKIVLHPAVTANLQQTQQGKGNDTGDPNGSLKEDAQLANKIQKTSEKPEQIEQNYKSSSKGPNIAQQSQAVERKQIENRGKETTGEGQSKHGKQTSSKRDYKNLPDLKMELQGYNLQYQIGEGGFCKVIHGTHKLAGASVAVKVIDKRRLQDQVDRNRISREIKVLKQLQHTSIIKLFEVEESEDALFLVMEKAGDSLLDYVRANKYLKEAEACYMLQQIVAGLMFCHENKVVHRDIKLENILLDEKKRIKIIDFGLCARITPGQKLSIPCGSPSYAAPEIVSREQYDGPPVDVWSLGVVLYAMVCGYLPFNSKTGNKQEICQSIIKRNCTFPEKLSPQLRDLLNIMLAVNPAKRITFEQILVHEWVRGEKQWDTSIRSQYAVDLSPSGEPMMNSVIANKVEQYGYLKEQLGRHLHSGRCNRLTALYHLLNIKQKSDAQKTKLFDKSSSHQLKNFTDQFQPRQQQRSSRPTTSQQSSREKEKGEQQHNRSSSSQISPINKKYGRHQYISNVQVTHGSSDKHSHSQKTGFGRVTNAANSSPRYTHADSAINMHRNQAQVPVSKW